MNKKVLKNSIIGFTILSGIGIVSSPLKAHASVVPYSVGVIEPENSLSQSYFDLLLGAGKSQTVNVQIANNSDREITLETYIAPARTESSGAVIYYDNSDKVDSSMKYNLSKYTKIDKEITISAGQTVKEPIQVTMPNEKFDGVVAGGVVFKQKNQNVATSSENSNGIAVKNEYQSTVGLLLRQNQNAVAPEINFGSIGTEIVNGRNFISAHIQNKKMAYIDDVSINAKVVNESDKDSSYYYTNENMQIAPNSSFDLPIPTSTENGNDGYSKPLKAGKYKATIVVYGNDKSKKSGSDAQPKYKWTTTKEFTVTSNQAKNINKLDVTLNPKDKGKLNWVVLSVFGLVAVIALGAVIWLISKRSKRKG